MSNYVFIESRDPFGPSVGGFVSETAADLKQQGHKVSVFLVQNGVLGARKSARGSHVPAMLGAGVTLMADEFSMRERGIEAGELDEAIKSCAIDDLVDLIADSDTKALWH